MQIELFTRAKKRISQYLCFDVDAWNLTICLFSGIFLSDAVFASFILRKISNYNFISLSYSDVLDGFYGRDRGSVAASFF